MATVVRETKREYEPPAGGTATLDAAGATREPPPLTRHSSAAEVVLRAAGEDTSTYGLVYQRQACQAAKIEQALV